MIHNRCTVSSKRNPKPAPAPAFYRFTFSLPAELKEFVETRARAPRHAGNLSSYIRDLVITDKEKSAA